MSIDLDELRKMCDEDAIRWTDHISLRMIKRHITPRQVIDAIQSGSIIEDYPDDFPFPSVLILGQDAFGHAIHVVCGLSQDYIHMITAYYPNPDEWEDDLKTRKKEP